LAESSFASDFPNKTVFNFAVKTNKGNFLTESLYCCNSANIP
jgi:hypothetical protein